MGRVPVNAGEFLMYPPRGLLLFQTFCVCNHQPWGKMETQDSYLCSEWTRAPKSGWRLSNSLRASSQHPGVLQFGHTVCGAQPWAGSCTAFQPPWHFVTQQSRTGFVDAPAQTQGCCPQRQKPALTCWWALTVPTFGQWQSLEAETFLKSLSNGCERDILLCIMNNFVPIKNIYCFKVGQGVRKTFPNFEMPWFNVNSIYILFLLT